MLKGSVIRLPRRGHSAETGPLMAFAWLQAADERGPDALYLSTDKDMRDMFERALTKTNEHCSLDGTVRTPTELATLVGMTIVDGEPCISGVDTRQGVAQYIGCIALEAGRDIAFFVLTVGSTKTYALIINESEEFYLLFDVAQGTIEKHGNLTRCLMLVEKGVGALYVCKRTVPVPVPVPVVITVPVEEEQQQQQQTKKKAPKKPTLVKKRTEVPVSAVVTVTDEQPTKKVAVIDIGSAEETVAK